MYATTNNIILACAEFRYRWQYTLYPSESADKRTGLFSYFDEIRRDPVAWALKELDYHIWEQRLTLQDLIALAREKDPVVQVEVCEPNYARIHQVYDICEVPCHLPYHPDLEAKLGDYFRCVMALTRSKFVDRTLKFVQEQGAPTLLAQVMLFAPPGSETYHDALSDIHGVGMVFELAGMQCPKAVDKWHLVKREFDPNQGVPYFCAGVRGAPHLGSVTCIATDHELVLVLGANSTLVRLVHVDALEDAMMDQIRSFVAKNSKDGKTKKPRKAREVSTTPTAIDVAQFL